MTYTSHLIADDLTRYVADGTADTTATITASELASVTSTTSSLLTDSRHSILGVEINHSRSADALEAVTTTIGDWTIDYDRLYQPYRLYPSYSEYEELKKRVEKLEELLTTIYHAKEIGDLV